MSAKFLESQIGSRYLNEIISDQKTFQNYLDFFEGNKESLVSTKTYKLEHAW